MNSPEGEAPTEPKSGEWRIATGGRASGEPKTPSPLTGRIGVGDETNSFWYYSLPIAVVTSSV